MSNKTTEHPHVVELVDDLLHGVLDEREAERVETHCERCESCQAALHQARKRFEALSSLPMVEASEDLIRRTVDAIDDRASKPARVRSVIAKWVFSATAAAALVVAGFNIYFDQLCATPYDLHVYGQTELLAGTSASLRIGLLDRHNGSLLSGVPVWLAIYNPATDQEFELANFNTDDNGSAQPTFTLPDWQQGEYELRVISQPNGHREMLTRRISLKRAWKLMLTTDKPLYQPGQTIHVRALGLRRPDLKPVAGAEALFSITDPKGNVIYQRTAVTSRFGITSTDCPLATEIIQGPYTIVCAVGETESSVTVEVKKYVLPKFQIDLKLDRSYYSPGQLVRGTVHAQYFFGKPVAGGTVEAVVLAESGLPNAPEQSIVTQTDNAGEATFEFNLPNWLEGRPQLDGDARFRVEVSVADTAGHEYTVRQTRVVTDNPIRVEVIPESGTLVRGVPNQVYLFASYADGKPARTRINISGRQELTTSKFGITSFELTPQSDQVGFNIRATDDQGVVGRRQVALTCGQSAQDFIIRTDKAVYQGGETARIIALGGGVEPVFLDFIKDGQTVLTRSIDMRQGRGEIQLDLPPELFGTVRLCAYRLHAYGIPVLKVRTVYVHQAGELNVTATLDRQQYRPGEKATLKLRLTDQSGQAVPGAISLSAVDEAVFHVLSQRPGIERTFFHLEQELLEPVYAIYNWSPGALDEQRDVEEFQQFEQALFATTVQTVSHNPYGGRNVVPDAETVVGERPKLVASPITLAATSYAAKASKMWQFRRNGLMWVYSGWFWVVMLGLIGLTVSKSKPMLIAFGILLGLLCLLVLAAICIVAIVGCGGAGSSGSAASSEMAEPPAIQRARAQAATDDEAAASPTRVRSWFPETLLWYPELITDDNGEASLDISLADSITSWRLNASAVSSSGQLGAVRESIRVFQPFFVDLDLPVALTRNDEVSVPVVVYNYLDKPQSVELTLANDEWFELIGANGPASTKQTIELAAGEVQSTSYRLRAKQVGQHTLQVEARASGIADAVRRDIEVVPDGRRVEQVFNGSLTPSAEIPLSIPDTAIPGSVTAIVKLYPSSFSQVVEGLDGIFQRPYGCFEQTSSTTYPNILALRYLKQTGKSVPEVEAKARQYIHLGYQRLLGFEVSGGGFDWFGNPPANTTLTAYGLMEFVDMAEVHDVDPNLIQRTCAWLLAQRKANGSWPADGRMLNDGLAGSVQRGGDLDLATTAYMAWAVYHKGGSARVSQATLNYLLAHSPANIESPYVLALMANAIKSMDPAGKSAAPYINRLNQLKTTSEDGKHVWWQLGQNQRTAFYGSGNSGNVEVTALAALAMLRSNTQRRVARRALSWLTEQRNASGTWGTTQATVLALKALVAGTSSPLGGEKSRRISVAWDGNPLRELDIPVDQAEVMQQLNLSTRFTRTQHTLTLNEQTNTSTGFQVALTYHVPEAAAAPDSEPLTIDVTYDRRTLEVNDTLTATAKATNNMPTDAPMVILDLPIPAGFRIDATTLDQLKADGKIAKYQLNARSAVIYLRQLAAGETLSLVYCLRATMPVKVSVPAATVYEYYTPERRGKGRQIKLTVGTQPF